MSPISVKSREGEAAAGNSVSSSLQDLTYFLTINRVVRQSLNFRAAKKRIGKREEEEKWRETVKLHCWGEKGGAVKQGDLPSRLITGRCNFAGGEGEREYLRLAPMLSDLISMSVEGTAGSLQVPQLSPQSKQSQRESNPCSARYPVGRKERVQPGRDKFLIEPRKNWCHWHR